MSPDLRFAKWRLERSRDFNARITLDLIARPHVVVVAHRDTALGTGTHFIDVILEAAQRFQLALEDHHVITQHADRIVPSYVTVHDDTACDRAELAGTEYVAHFGQTNDLLFDLRRQHAGDQRLHIVDGFVNDAVVANIDPRLLDHC